jgi:hypothetical protein
VGKGFHKTMFYSVFPPKVSSQLEPRAARLQPQLEAVNLTRSDSTHLISSLKSASGSTHR